MIHLRTSGESSISWPRIVRIELPRQVDTSSGSYVRRAIELPPRQVDTWSGSYIRRAIDLVSHRVRTCHTHIELDLDGSEGTYVLQVWWLGECGSAGTGITGAERIRT